MVSTKIKVDYSNSTDTDIALDSTLNEISINKGGYEELTIRLTEVELQSLFTQMAAIGYGELYMEKLRETERELDKAQDYIAQLEAKVYE